MELRLDDAWEILRNPYKLLSLEKTQALLAEYGITEACELAYCESGHLEALARNVKPIPRQAFLRYLLQNRQRNLITSNRVETVDIEGSDTGSGGFPRIKCEPVAVSAAPIHRSGVTFTVTLENIPSRPRYGKAMTTASSQSPFVSDSKNLIRRRVASPTPPASVVQQKKKRSRPWDDSSPADDNNGSSSDHDAYRSNRHCRPRFNPLPEDDDDISDEGGEDEEGSSNEQHGHHQEDSFEEFGIDCPLCSVKHYSSPSLSRHLKEDHASARSCADTIIGSISSWKCPQCPEMVLFPDDLRTHMQHAHGYGSHHASSSNDRTNVDAVLRRLAKERRMRVAVAGSNNSYYRSMRTAATAATAAVIAGSHIAWKTAEEEEAARRNSRGAASSSSSTPSRDPAVGRTSSSNNNSNAAADVSASLLKEIVCSECPLSFQTKQSFMQHTCEMHSWTRIYTWRHLTRRYHELQWQCHMCKRRQLLPAELKTHLQGKHCVSETLSELAIKIELDLEARHKKLYGHRNGELVVVEPLLRALPETRKLPSEFAVKALAAIQSSSPTPPSLLCLPASGARATTGQLHPDVIGMSFTSSPWSSSSSSAAAAAASSSTFASFVSSSSVGGFVPMAALSTIVKTATPTDPMVVVSGDGDDVSVFECETQPLLLLPTTQHEEGLQGVLEDCP